MFARNLSHGTQSTPEHNDVITLLLLLSTLNVPHVLLVSLVLTLNMYLFSEFDIFIFQTFLD